MTKLFDYQWEAVCFLAEEIRDGQRRLGLVMPTGSGKSLILSVLLHKLKCRFKSAVVATPLDAIRGSFTSVKRAEADASKLSGTGWAGVARFDFEGFWHLADKERVRADREAFKKHVRVRKAESFALVTTHHALRLWSREEEGWSLPDDLTGRVLVLDEAHHADRDGEETLLAEVAQQWHRRGGTVISTTATPFRNNGDSIFGEDTRVYMRSIAEHATALEMEFKIDRTVVDDTSWLAAAEVEGSKHSKASRKFIKAIADRWEADGRPKTVCIVPAVGSKGWTDGLIEALRKVHPGVRVHDAVGATAAQRDDLDKLLKRERLVTRYEDSEVDVIIACRRFDEGSDWPLCSHVYNIGLPQSYGLLIQRWGRAMRSKRGVVDYPSQHASSASIVFFMATKISKEAMEAYEKKSRNTALLVALFMADHTVAARFAKPPGQEKVPTLEGVRKRQSRAIPDYLRTQAQKMVLEQAVRFGESASEEKWTQWVNALPASSLQETQVRRAAVRVMARSGFIARVASGAKTLDKSLADEFEAVAEEFAGTTSSEWIDGTLKVYSSFTGGTAEEVRERLAAGVGRKDGAIPDDVGLAAVRRYLERTGHLPTVRSIAEKSDFGFDYVYQWWSFDYNLRTTRGITLVDWLELHGWGRKRKKPEPKTKAITLRECGDIKDVALRFRQATGRYPGADDHAYIEWSQSAPDELREVYSLRTLRQYLKSRGLTYHRFYVQYSMLFSCVRCFKITAYEEASSCYSCEQAKLRRVAPRLDEVAKEVVRFVSAHGRWPRALDRRESGGLWRSLDILVRDEHNVAVLAPRRAGDAVPRIVDHVDSETAKAFPAPLNPSKLAQIEHHKRRKLRLRGGNSRKVFSDEVIRIVAEQKKAGVPWSEVCKIYEGSRVGLQRAVKRYLSRVGEE